MSSSIYISIEMGQITLAETADGLLHNFATERNERQVGSIYKGRVENVLPGMDAAFVDIGTERNALLYIADTVEGEGRRIQDVLQSGQPVIVQITRPGVREKGARISQKLSLAGRHVVMISHSESIGVSKRIHEKSEREKLRHWVEKLRPLDYGIVVRTEAEGIGETALAQDVAFLERQFRTIEAEAAQAKAPALLYRDMGLLGRFVRDRLSADVDRVLIDNVEEYHALRRLVTSIAPDYLTKIELYQDEMPLFERFGLSQDMDKALQRVVPLPSGGNLTFDEAEALTAIDVNTGRFVGRNRLAETVLATNLEAAHEIARQLRLRDVGGIIIIDFIDMDNARDRVKLMNAFEIALRDDRVKTRIVDISPLGLVEMTRQREHEPLHLSALVPCETCQGLGVVKSPSTIATEMLRRLRASLAKNPPSKNSVLELTVHPLVALTLIENGRADIQQIETRWDISLRLLAEETLHREANRIQIGLASLPALTVGQEISTSIIASGDVNYFIENMVIVFIKGEQDNKEARAKSVVITEVNSLFARASLRES